MANQHTRAARSAGAGFRERRAQPHSPPAGGIEATHVGHPVTGRRGVFVNYTAIRQPSSATCSSRPQPTHGARLGLVTPPETGAQGGLFLVSGRAAGGGWARRVSLFAVVSMNFLMMFTASSQLLWRDDCLRLGRVVKTPPGARILFRPQGVACNSRGMGCAT